MNQDIDIDNLQFNKEALTKLIEEIRGYFPDKDTKYFCLTFKLFSVNVSHVPEAAQDKFIKMFNQ